MKNTKIWKESDFLIVDIKALNASAVLGYCDGDSLQYHVVVKEEFEDDKKEMLDTFLCVNSMYGFDDLSTSTKRITDITRLFNTCYDSDANLWESLIGIDSCYALSIGSKGAELIHEYNVLKTSFDLSLILDSYLHIIKEVN